jgi:hypothetical protein
MSDQFANAAKFRVVGDVAVGVDRGLDVAMAQAPADHMQRDAGQQQGCRVCQNQCGVSWAGSSGRWRLRNRRWA